MPLKQDPTFIYFKKRAVAVKSQGLRGGSPELDVWHKVLWDGAIFEKFHEISQLSPHCVISGYAQIL